MFCNSLLELAALPEGAGPVQVTIESTTQGSNFVPVTGMFDPATGMFHGEGMGTVAGFPNISIEMDMQMQLDGTFEATYTMGANGELPGGNPGVYEITGQFDLSSLPTPSPSPSPSPTGTAPAGLETVWGNANCSGDDKKEPPDPVDSLLTLRSDAGLSTNTGDCPALGTMVTVGPAVARHASAAQDVIWGDVDCSMEAPDPVDSLKILRFDAGLSVAQEAGCPMMGSEIVIAEG
jgi:hypothetical protein